MSTNKNTGSITLADIPNGDLKDTKSSMAFFLLFGIPSAFFKSTEMITFPNSGGLLFSPPYTLRDSISLNCCFKIVL